MKPRIIKVLLFSFKSLALASLVALHSANLLAHETTPDHKPQELQPGQMPYFDVVPDPIEGFNRRSWAVNEGLFRGVIYPLGFVYNTVVPKPVRTSISNAGHNATYPVRNSGPPDSR